MRSDSEEFRELVAAFAGYPCVDCYSPFVIELRPEKEGDGTFFKAKPPGSASIAGAQVKVLAIEVTQGHPWAVCQGCGRESRAKPVSTEGTET